MPLMLRTLVELPELGLRVRTCPDALNRPITWVHTSELPDPTPFLEGGELLLTTGLGLRRGGARHEPYVRRLADAGVAGLGFGVGLSHEDVPPAMAAAAQAHGLPVIEVPRDTPFIAISKAVSRAIVADEYAAVTRVYEAQKALTRAALAPDGFHALVRQLARQVQGWALLLDSTGRVVHAAPATAAQVVGRLADDVERLRGRRAPASAAVTVGGEEFVLQSLGGPDRVRGFLAVGRSRTLTASDRHIVNAAASLLTLALDQARRLEAAHHHLRAGLFHLLLRGEASVVRRTTRELWGGLPREPLRVFAVSGEPVVRATVADNLEAAATRLREALFHADVDDRLIVVTADGQGVAARFGDVPAAAPGAIVGVSEPVGYRDLSTGYRQAEQAVEAARRSQVQLMRFADILGSGLLGIVEAERAQTFAQAILAPLIEHDSTGRGDLLASLAVWLEHHGQWDPAAARLGVHRHTLRNRIGKVEQLLGRSLDSPGVRAELWLALQFRDVSAR